MDETLNSADSNMGQVLSYVDSLGRGLYSLECLLFFHFFAQTNILMYSSLYNDKVKCSFCAKRLHCLSIVHCSSFEWRACMAGH